MRKPNWRTIFPKCAPETTPSLVESICMRRPPNTHRAHAQRIDTKVKHQQKEYWIRLFLSNWCLCVFVFFFLPSFFDWIMLDIGECEPFVTEWYLFGREKSGMIYLESAPRYNFCYNGDADSRQKRKRNIPFCGKGWHSVIDFLFPLVFSFVCICIWETWVVVSHILILFAHTLLTYLHIFGPILSIPFICWCCWVCVCVCVPPHELIFTIFEPFSEQSKWNETSNRKEKKRAYQNWDNNSRISSFDMKANTFFLVHVRYDRNANRTFWTIEAQNCGIWFYLSLDMCVCIRVFFSCRNNKRVSKILTVCYRAIFEYFSRSLQKWRENEMCAISNG